MLHPKMSVWCFLLFKFMILSLLSGPTNASSNYEFLRESFIKIIFGDQWKLNEYCSNHYSDKQIATNDLRIQSLYHGSLLRAINGSTNWPVILNQLEELEQLGLQSRQTLGIVCSANVWGFADSNDEQLANEPRRDDTECQRQLEGLYGFVETLTNKISSGKRLCGIGDGIGNGKSFCQLKPNVSEATSGSSFDLHFWQQFHSFGRLPSGPPYKQHLLLGDYDNCARLESTRYCMGAYGRRDADSQSHLIGLCLPRSCSSELLRSSKKLMRQLNVLVKKNMPDFMQDYREQPAMANQLNDVFCPPANDSSYMNLFKDKLSIVLALLPVPWTLLLIYATYTNGGNTSVTKDQVPTKRDSILDSFNLKANWSKFMDSCHLDERLAGLSAFKTLAMIWLMGTHFSMILFPYVKNLNELYSYYMSTVHGPIILQGQHCVPIFFIISGLLFGFKYLNRNVIDAKQMILWRYFRLMPMYLVVYAYTKKFAHLIGDGPLWDSGVSNQSEMRQCLLESWSVPLLMLSNFTPPFAHCLITGWHISNDFQIYLAIPFLLYAYRRSRTYGTLMAVSTFLLTHISHMWFWGTAKNYDLARLMTDSVRFGPRYILDRMSLDYVNPLGRLGTYFIGVLIADLLLIKGHNDNNTNNQQQQQEGKQDKTNEGRTNAVRGEQRVATAGSCKRSRADKITSDSGESLIEPPAAGQSSELAERPVNVTFCKSDGHQQEITGQDNGDDSGGGGDGGRDGHAGHRPAVEKEERRCRRVGPPACATMMMIMADQNRPLASFKDKCRLAFGVFVLLVGLFSVFIPPDGPLTELLGPYSKAVGYPMCRLAVELGWSILLYYFLLTNLRPAKVSGDGGGSLELSGSASANATPRETPPAVTTTKKKHNLLVIDDVNNKSMVGSSSRHSNHHEADEPILVLVLKWPIWNVLVKVNYAIMLTHYALFRFIVQSQRDLFLFSWFNFLQTLTLLILLSYLLGAIVHLTIEMPLSAMVRMFVSRVLLARSARVGGCGSESQQVAELKRTSAI